MAEEKSSKQLEKVFTPGLILGVVTMTAFCYFYPKDRLGGAPLVAFAAFMCGIAIFTVTTATILRAKGWRGMTREDFLREARWLCGLRARRAVTNKGK